MSDALTHHEELVELIADTASRFVATVVAMDDGSWGEPGLGVWSIRELVGHTLRAFSTVDRFLENPMESVDVGGAGEYYRVALQTIPDMNEAVAERGREAGVGLGDDPREAVVEQVSETMGRLGDTSGDEIGLTAVGGMRLADYLETRLVELVVHYSDLCAALGMPAVDLGEAEVRAASTVLASATPADRDLVLRSMLGRADLPSRFNVWK